MDDTPSAWDALSALRKTLPFTMVGEVALARLAERGSLVLPAPGATIVDAGAAPDGLYLVISGEVDRYAAGGALLDRIEAGGSFGATELLFGRRAAQRYVAGDAGPVRLFRVPAQAIGDLLRSDFAFGRGLRRFADQFRMDGGHEHHEEAPLPAGRPAAPVLALGPRPMYAMQRAEIIVFRRGAEVSFSGAAIGLMMECTARAVALDAASLGLDDRLLYVRVVPGAEPASNETARAGGGLDFARVGKDAFAAALDGWAAKYDYLFLDDLDLSPADERPPFESERPTTVVWVGRGSMMDAPAAGATSRSIALHVAPPLHTTSIVANMARAVAPGHAVRTADSRVRERTTLNVDVALLSRSAPPAPAQGASRLPVGLDFDAFCRDLDGAHKHDHACSRDGFSRVGRCLTQRMLGVALGGGGALGFAHVPLLAEMRRNGLPVDLVAGSSFGAVVAAYYCARPRMIDDPRHGRMPEGLSLLLSRIRPLQSAINACVVTNVPAQMLFDSDLGFLDVRDMPVPCAPVATDIVTGSRAPIAEGPIGLAISASGAAPVLFVPVTTPEARFVDGGVVDNVPADVVARMGSSLVVTSNPIPSVSPWLPPPPLLPGWLGRQIYNFNPLYRGIDGARSLYTVAKSFSAATASAGPSRGRVAFQADGLPVAVKGLFFDFGIAPIVMSAAERALEQQDTIATIRKRWREVIGSRARPA
jgi:predicted patatin/cPLA2 family phospholipase